jgi:methyltransferase (TIGR00027 family)
MSERSSSQTAWGVMVLRAAHQIIDDQPRILDDPVAVRLLDDATLSQMRAPESRLHLVGARRLRAHVVIRSRYAEDQLALAVQRGVTQYLLLGAGYDTFAYRQPAWAAALRVFEVDHPTSQQAKRDKLAAVGVHVPGNVTYAPIDFEVDTLHAGLERAGFDFAQPTFISCLGVLMYLTEAAVYEIFDFVATLPKGSEIVATFRSRRDGEGPGDSALAKAAASVGEPWLSDFDPWELRQELEQRFGQVTLVSGAELEVMYALHRRDGVTPGRSISTVRAEV